MTIYEPFKRDVLQTIYDQIRKYNKIEDGYQVTLHYNGHGTVAHLEANKHLCGRWVCTNDETISIHEILQVCNEAYDRRIHPTHARLGIKIINDTCGASGLLYDMLRRERVYPNIWQVSFYFASDWNEVSYAHDLGGKFTQDFLENDIASTGP